jgi:hypothetical protein
VVSASDPLTSTEIGLVSGLNSLPITPNGQAIAKTGANTFANVSTSGTGGSGYQAPLTGNVDGINQTFTWATAPNVIVQDNAGTPLQKVEQGGQINWTGTTTTVMTIPPNTSIFATA